MQLRYVNTYSIGLKFLSQIIHVLPICVMGVLYWCNYFSTYSLGDISRYSCVANGHVSEDYIVCLVLLVSSSFGYFSTYSLGEISART